jgi:hypothetical protein
VKNRILPAFAVIAGGLLGAVTMSPTSFGFDIPFPWWLFNFCSADIDGVTYTWVCTNKQTCDAFSQSGHVVLLCIDN